ncbi:MAG: outer membrane protein [Sulfurovaceae bacterium]
MKKFSGSIVVGLLLSSFALAGGDIAPVEPAVVVPAPVVDDSGFYLGVAYGFGHTDEDYTETFVGDVNTSMVGTGEVDYNAIMAQAGYKFNQYIALEGRYWWSLGHNDWKWSENYYVDGVLDGSASGSDADGDELRAWGIYIKPMFPVTEQFDIYALLGYGNVKLSDDAGEWLDENDFQWGIGASYEFTENLSIFVDYVRLLDEGDSSIVELIEPGGILTSTWDDTVYTINVGLTYKF